MQYSCGMTEVDRKYVDDRVSLNRGYPKIYPPKLLMWMWSGPKDLTKYFSEGTETINGIWRGPKDLTEYFLSSRGYCTVPGTQIHKGIFQTSTPTTTVQYVFSSYDRQTVRDQPIIFIHLYGVRPHRLPYSDMGLVQFYKYVGSCAWISMDLPMDEIRWLLLLDDVWLMPLLSNYSTQLTCCTGKFVRSDLFSSIRLEISSPPTTTSSSQLILNHTLFCRLSSRYLASIHRRSPYM